MIIQKSGYTIAQVGANNNILISSRHGRLLYHAPASRRLARHELSEIGTAFIKNMQERQEATA